MSYQKALEAAGAVVHRFFESGDYQGSWYAFVWYRGELGWVHGGYGSCSGCDAFQGEFDSAYEPRKGETKEELQVRLAKFGEAYLDDIVSFQTLVGTLRSRSYFGDEEEAAVKKLTEIAREFGLELEGQ